jgi:hypothetical protein
MHQVGDWCTIVGAIVLFCFFSPHGVSTRWGEGFHHSAYGIPWCSVDLGVGPTPDGAQIEDEQNANRG